MKRGLKRGGKQKNTDWMAVLSGYLCRLKAVGPRLQKTVEGAMKTPKYT